MLKKVKNNIYLKLCIGRKKFRERNVLMASYYKYLNLRSVGAFYSLVLN